MERAERIPIASDHAGLAMKEHVAGVLRALGRWLDTPFDGGRNATLDRKIELDEPAATPRSP